MKLISVYVTPEMYEIKRKTGHTWRSLIMRGINSVTNKEGENVKELNEKIGKMATRLQQMSTRIHELENVDTKT